MPVKRGKRAPHFWEVRFWLAGVEVRRSSKTHDKRAAEAYEEKLRAALWRQNKLGEKHFTWDDATERLKAEHVENPARWRSFERTERALEQLRMLQGAPLTEVAERENLLRIRRVLAGRRHRGELVKHSTVNRVLAELSKILNLCVDEWKMLDSTPKVPLFRIEDVEPIWASREQIARLLSELHESSADMSILACASGMRMSEVTHLEISSVDLKRGTAFVKVSSAKNRTGRVVPLNADAIAVLTKWIERERKCDTPYVFYFRQIAPIKRLSTRAFREACQRAELPPGFSFHKLRHTWASWHAQDETPLQVIMMLGGWKSLAMVQRYAHLSKGHLAQYADRSLIGRVGAEEEQKPERTEMPNKRRA